MSIGKRGLVTEDGLEREEAGSAQEVTNRGAANSNLGDRCRLHTPDTRNQLDKMARRGL